MATFQSFATTASNVVVDNNERTITVSNEVVEIDGTLDAPSGGWDGWTIICQSSGGFRSVAGATGTLGGGTHSMKIVEKANGKRYGADNYTQGSGSNRARFFGDTTNTLKYSNILWIIEAGGRSDFDIYRGTNNNGSAGPAVEFTGVSVIQLSSAGTEANFNHYTGNASIKIHPEVGYGLRITNYTNGHAIEISNPIQSGAVIEGLQIANVTATNNDGNPSGSAARLTVQLNQIAANGSLVLANLNTPSITDVSGSSDKTLVLVDPVGLPSITDNWGRHVFLEVRRTVPFVFTGAQPSGETMHAINQNSGGQDATAVMNGATGSIQVRTQRTATNTTLSWTDYHDYRFFMAGLGFRKYALNTNTEITNTPSTITAALTPDVLPDGSAISTVPVNNAGNLPATVPEVLRHIKDHEVANPTHASYPVEPLIYVDGNAAKLHSDYRMIMNSAGTTPLWNIGEISGNDTVQFRTESTINAGNGLTTIDVTGTGETITNTNVAEGDGVFFKDSTGQRSIVKATNNMGATTRFALVNTSNGNTLASSNITNGSSANLSITTKGLTTGYRLVSKRPGYNYYSADVDLTGGGLKEFTASAQTQIVQPDGSASYVSAVSVPASLTIDITNSGTTPAARVECGDATYSARQIFKAWEDKIATSDGDKYMGLGGAQITYTNSALKGNEIVLGAHTKVKRKATGDDNATIRATLYAPDDAPVDGVNGDVQTIEGLDIPAVATEIWSADNRTLTSGGGGGGSVDIDPDDIWGYREIIATYTPTGIIDGDLVFSNMDVFTTGNSVRIVNNGGYTGATNGQDFYVRHAGSAIQLFNDRATAIAGTQNARIRLTGAGTIGNVRLATLTTTAIDRINSIPADVWSNNTRTTTDPAPPTTSAIATAVWSADDRSLTTTGGTTPEDVWEYRTRTGNLNTPTGVSSDGDLEFSSADRVEMNGQVVRINSTGGYGGIEVGDLYWARSDGNGINLYENERDYLLSNRGNRTTLTGSGTFASIRVELMSETVLYTMRDIPSDVWNVNNRQLSGTQLTVNNIATGVWSATTRTLSNTDNIWSNSNALTASDIWTNSTRTITGGAPTASENAEAVWGTDIQIVSNTSTTFSPQIVTGSFLILNSAEDTAGMSNGDPIGINDDGGFTNLVEGTTYYARPNGTLLELYADRNNAINGTGSPIFPVGGVASSLVLSVTRRAVTRNLGDASDVLKDILLDTEAVISPPTAMAISDAVLNATIHEGQRAAYNFIPEDEDKNAFRITAEAANQIRNGDTIRFTNTGGYTEFTTGVDYFVYKAYNDLFIYRNHDNAQAGNFQFITITSNGTPSNVRITRTADSGYVTVKAAFDALLSNTDSTIHGIDNVLEGIADFTGADFIETGLSLKQAMQICTAILAGKLVVTNEGNTFTFHRLDTGETAVIRATGSDNGRTAPARNPT